MSAVHVAEALARCEAKLNEHLYHVGAVLRPAIAPTTKQAPKEHDR